MRMKEFKFRATGAAPLICHNGQMADPLNEFSKKLKVVSGKRKKTDADFEAMSHIEFLGSLYMGPKGPCLPGEMIEATLVNAGKLKRIGKDVVRALWCNDAPVLEYEGPHDPEKMYKDGGFTFKIGVRVKQNRVVRTRPRFDKWACDITLLYDEETLNKAVVEELVGLAGEAIGFGDWRPKFGRFTIEAR